MRKIVGGLFGVVGGGVRFEFFSGVKHPAAFVRAFEVAYIQKTKMVYDIILTF